MNNPNTPKNVPRKKAKKISRDYLHNAGLYYLQRFAASADGFRKVMRRKIMRSLKDHPDQDIEACHAALEVVIEGFVRSGLINDQSYAAAKTASMRRAGRSSKYIIQALGHKGIAPADAEAALRDFDQGEGVFSRNAGDSPDLAAAQAFIRKRRARLKAPEKTLAALARAGFSYDIARKALEELAS